MRGIELLTIGGYRSDFEVGRFEVDVVQRYAETHASKLFLKR